MPLPASFPDLASLDLFVSVIELGSVSRAAEAHGITQPSASSRIKHLERQLDLRLLDRGPGGSVPTDAGVVVAGWAEGILRAAHELSAGLSAFQAEQTGRLRIAASFTIAEYLLPQWLDRFSRDQPRDSIALEVAKLDESEDAAFFNLPKLRRTLQARLAEAQKLRAAQKKDADEADDDDGDSEAPASE